MRLDNAIAPTDPPDEQTISEITRSYLLDEVIALGTIEGRLSVVDFLKRTWPLDTMPSTDGRYPNAAGDICQHMVNNQDYTYDYLFIDYLDLLNTDDRTFCRFLESLVDPVVRRPDQVESYVETINRHVKRDGWILSVDRHHSGYPIYKMLTTAMSDVASGPLGFPLASPEDDLVTQAEALKTELLELTLSQPDESRYSNARYKRLRRLLVAHPILGDTAPEYVRSCLSLDDLYASLSRHGPVDSTREYVRESMNRVLSALDLIDHDEIPNCHPLREQIGIGGFGVVYKAEHKLLDGVSFAVKVFAEAFSPGGTSAVERFLREAKVLFALNHPNIIQIHDVGLVGRRPYIKMAYFPGPSLREALLESGAFAPEKALAVVTGICEALEHAHGKGIVHRDLKPSNILVASGSVRVIDFGMGIMAESELESRLTRTGEAKGGDVYTAPELVASPKLIDERTDLYSVGAIWYEMLTCQPPRPFRTAERLRQVHELPESHISLIECCLEDIDARVRDCGTLLQRLRDLGGEGSKIGGDVSATQQPVPDDVIGEPSTIESAVWALKNAGYFAKYWSGNGHKRLYVKRGTRDCGFIEVLHDTLQVNVKGAEGVDVARALNEAGLEIE